MRRRVGSRRAIVIGMADDEPVDDDLDRVLVLLVELDLLVEVVELAVDPDPDEARLLGAGEELLVLALAVADERCHEHHPLALGQGVDLVDHLLDRLPLDLAAADRAMHAADAGEEQPQVVVDLGDRADRRARVLRRALLVDADRRRQPVDLVDVGLLHLAEELPRIGGQGLDVAALALGVDRVERKARLAAAGQAGDDDQAVARHLDVDVLQVVFAGTADHDLVGGHRMMIVAGIGPMRTPVRFAIREPLSIAGPGFCDAPELFAQSRGTRIVPASAAAPRARRGEKSAYHRPLALTVRSCVSKSTCTIPNGSL